MDQGKATGSPSTEIVTPAPHTPLPWRVEGGLALRVVADDAKGIMPIADIRGWGHLTGKGHGALGLPENEAIAIQDENAAIIVRAVNSYAALVTSLQEMMGIYWGAGDGELPEPGCIIRARKALSEAGVTVQSPVNGSGEVNQ